MTLRIATAAAFPNDRAAAQVRQLANTDLGVVLLSYLDGQTTSRLALLRENNPRSGFVEQVTAALAALTPRIYLDPDLRVVTDAGGLNPLACAEVAAQILSESGSGEVPLGVVQGDDLLGSLDELFGSGCPLDHAQSRARFADLQFPIVAAHAELGASGVAQAMSAGARVVICGSVAAPALVTGAALSHFGWAWDDWDALSAAAVAGSLMSLGASLVQGGEIAGDSQARLALGPPVAELGSRGQVKISVPGGRLSRQAVAVALAGRAIDPAHWLTPDVDVNLSTVQVAERAERQEVLLWGVVGRPPAASYEVTLWYHGGFTTTATLLVMGKRSGETARCVPEIVFNRVRESGIQLEHASWQRLAPPSVEQLPDHWGATIIRLEAADSSRAAIEGFASEVCAVAQTRQLGLVLIDQERPSVRPWLRRWPSVVPRELVDPIVNVRPAKDWL